MSSAVSAAVLDDELDEPALCSAPVVSSVFQRRPRSTHPMDPNTQNGHDNLISDSSDNCCLGDSEPSNADHSYVLSQYEFLNPTNSETEQNCKFSQPKFANSPNSNDIVKSTNFDSEKSFAFAQNNSHSAPTLFQQLDIVNPSNSNLGENFAFAQPELVNQTNSFSEPTDAFTQNDLTNSNICNLEPPTALSQYDLVQLTNADSQPTYALVEPELVNATNMTSDFEQHYCVSHNGTVSPQFISEFDSPPYSYIETPEPIPISPEFAEQNENNEFSSFSGPLNAGLNNDLSQLAISSNVASQPTVEKCPHDLSETSSTLIIACKPKPKRNPFDEFERLLPNHCPLSKPPTPKPYAFCDAKPPLTIKRKKQLQNETSTPPQTDPKKQYYFDKYLNDDDDETDDLTENPPQQPSILDSSFLKKSNPYSRKKFYQQKMYEKHLNVDEN